MEDKFKSMKETLMSTVSSQLGRLDKVDAKELGEVIDMIKDLEEASYYCSVVKAMDKKDEKEEAPQNIYYYTTPAYPPYYRPTGYDDYWKEKDRIMYDKMYYTQPRDSQGRFTEDGRGERQNYGGNGSGSSSGASSGGSSGSNSGGSRMYTEPPYMMAEWRDVREGKSPRSRRTYMDSKSTNQDQAIKIKELEKYMKELSEDLVDMISDASPEEKMTLHNKLSELANKLK